MCESHGDVLTVADPWLTYRMLDHWTRRGYVQADRHTVSGCVPDVPGRYTSGTPRCWPDGTGALLRDAAMLVRAYEMPTQLAVDGVRARREPWLTMLRHA